MKAPTRTHLGNRGKWNRPMPPAYFPRANGATLADAPDRCTRCGGPWRIVPEGYACYLCPGHFLAADKLTERVGRTLAHDRWPMRVPTPSKKHPMS